MAEPMAAIPVGDAQNEPRLSAVPTAPPEGHIAESPTASISVRVPSSAANEQGGVLGNLGLVVSRIRRRTMDFADREPVQFVLAITIVAVTAGAALRLWRSLYE